MEKKRSVTSNDTRERIIAAAADLLDQGGREAVSTRAVSAAASVQAPAIYRLFGDKQGLLDAVATHGFASFLQSKIELDPGVDPVEDLRIGWDVHVGFGLAHPALYCLIYGEPRPGASPPAVLAAAAVLAEKIHRIAAAGRLGISEERAAHLVHAAGCGTTLTLIALPEAERDLALSTFAREAIIAAIVTGVPAPAPPGPVSTAILLRAMLPQSSGLTSLERALLAEWLDRIANG